MSSRGHTQSLQEGWIFFLISVSQAGIYQLLTSLDEHKASGPDRISPYILKHCADEITLILHIIFTQSLSTSLLPNDWLKANICPVHKKGSRSNVSSYFIKLHLC